MSCPPTTIAEWLQGLPGSQQGPHQPGGPGTVALIGLGSNLPEPTGSPVENLLQAAQALQSLSPYPVLLSPIVQTAPLDCPPGSPDFANAVAVVWCPDPLDADQVLARLQSIESAFGRRRSGIVNEARSLDLDLLSFGAQQSCSETLTLPHPRALQRLFVMEPLAAIWPDYCFPGSEATAVELRDVLRAMNDA